jgi:hypothetical protein
MPIHLPGEKDMARAQVWKKIDELRPHFAFASSDRIKVTIEASTQFY